MAIRAMRVAVLMAEFVRAVTTGRQREVARLIREPDSLLEQTLNQDEEAVAAAIGRALLLYITF